MKDILAFAKEILLERLEKNGTFVDFTMGNGHDTLYFAQYCSEGHVYAFDVQEMALENTKKLLDDNGGFDNVTLIHDSHHRVDQYVQGEIDAGIFNLGYLPGSDKSVTTQCDTTMEALDKAVKMLKIGGVIVVVIYPGHSEGTREADMVEQFCAKLDKHTYNTYKYALLNKKNPPYIVAAEKFIPMNRYTGERL
ncbi:MAG: class I SAM-dependent methyltransferase [Oscillospiraceae bacterium]|nr:class I SAM-dependent methyltransferase [Oscillospiraceae bacterium]